MEPAVKETSQKEIKEVLNRHKEYFNKQCTKPIDFRIEQLKKLKQSIKNSEQDIFDALKKDLNKSEFESYLTEVGILYSEIDFTLKSVRKWAKPKKVKTALTHFGSKGYIIPEPFGTALIIAPWNYPVQLALSPLVGAIAAGNTAVIKPSELTPNVSKVIIHLVSTAFSSEYISVVEGGAETSQSLLKQEMDYIFFTGSVNVGKVVMEAASKRLIPVTLELGGKSPCIVHKDANIKLAAKRIVFGKFTNAGQTCIAPDYLFVHKEIKDELISSMKQVITEFYGHTPIAHDSYGKIVNSSHFKRLQGYLNNGRIIIGGDFDESSLKIAPTIMDDVDWKSPVMQEEIFGPIFPVLEYSDITDVIMSVNKRPKPLALYLFTQSGQVERSITGSISFGGGSINDTLMHIATPYLPFGGVGESGTGSYHGMSSFQTFSHYKSILKQTNAFDFTFKYPSAKHGLKIMRKLLK
ncbi:aldehyde dehydrogenase (NAD+) [Peribacillus deserti]|uniref:Aldehyde dehydrogenase n=1 Tax=Peribacillus deserti TaxID=673318 RepID=A0ABS2QDJ1_9BACI|nr:aldehyde dehydrogenase [Peribacillus deserti]MBM7691167.1 aldehyde dehydrogenase (NAD+) [Peribacillus deserti]